VIQRVLFGAALGALMIGSTLVACSAGDSPLYDAVSPPADTPVPEIVESAVVPTAITIPVIGVHSSLKAYGLTDAGELEVPPVSEPLQAGYYGGADPEFTGDEYLPGENGPAIVMGHVDGVLNGKKGSAGVFYRLHELQAGDEILIDRDRQPQLRFIVTGVQHYAKAAFDTAAVYGATQKPELRLITCGGAFDRTAGHYVDNVVIFAELQAAQQT
jgi:sortase (surface protein transpeptidase)